MPFGMLPCLVVLYLTCIQDLCVAHPFDHPGSSHLETLSDRSTAYLIPSTQIITQLPPETAIQSLVPGTKGVSLTSNHTKFVQTGVCYSHYCNQLSFDARQFPQI